MKARTKFIIGASLVVVTVGYLMAEGIKDTGVYFLMPAELAERVASDPTIYDVGVRLGGNVPEKTTGHERAAVARPEHSLDPNPYDWTRKF